jgi:hypothetical protein
MTQRPSTKLPTITNPQRHVGDAQDDFSLEFIDYNDPKAANWYMPPGPHEHDLRCARPNCPEILMIGWTVEAAQKEFAGAKPRVALCKCGTYSALPGHVATL